METIIIPTDFSENARTALLYAVEMFRDEKRTEFVLINAYRSPHAGSEVLVSLNDILAKVSKDSIAMEEEVLRAELRDTDRRIRSHSVYGEITDHLRKTAGGCFNPLIVMGTKGATGLKEWIFGSVASGVVRHVHFPTLIIPENTRFKAPKKILLASDYEELTTPGVLKPLIGIARKYKSAISILNVSAPHARAGEKAVVVPEEPDYIDQLAEFPIRFCFAEGNPEVSIRQYLKARDFDLVVAISRKGNFFHNLFHKSVTAQLAMHVEAPLLVLHEGE